MPAQLDWASPVIFLQKDWSLHFCISYGSLKCITISIHIADPENGWESRIARRDGCFLDAKSQFWVQANLGWPLGQVQNISYIAKRTKWTSTIALWYEERTERILKGDGHRTSSRQLAPGARLLSQRFHHLEACKNVWTTYRLYWAYKR